MLATYTRMRSVTMHGLGAKESHGGVIPTQQPPQACSSGRHPRLPGLVRIERNRK